MRSKGKLRWYEISDQESGLVMAATSHSKAKIHYGVDLTGNYDNFEALKYLSAKVVKVQLSQEPKESGEEYGDVYELLKKGVWHSMCTYEDCLNCGQHCYEHNPQYFSEEAGKFYCWECEKEVEKLLLSKK